MKKMIILLLSFMFPLMIGNAAHAALVPGATYTITVQKMNSNGAVSDYSTTSAVADGDGKLAFSLSSMPTNAECNFIVIIIKDVNGIVVRKGFVPAPPAGATNLMGVNGLSTAQTNAILSAGQVIGTDDPIAVAYMITLLRAEGATESDATNFANLGKFAIVGTGGFESTLTASGVTAAQLAAFKSYLIYNPTAGKKTIRDLTAGFKTAVDSSDATTAQKEMQKAGGFMADVFMDAASSAGIDMTLILAAHDAAGNVSQAHPEIMNAISANVRSSMDQSMTAFFQRIAAVKVKSEYTKALNTLNASGAQVDTFNAAVTAMMNAMQSIDSDYAGFYSDPQAYCAAHGKDFATVQNEMSTRFQGVFTAFQAAIESPNADITTMKANVVSAFNINAAFLPNDFGKYYNFDGVQKNWPIPQVVMVNWIANIIAAGGTFTYTRDTLAIPTMMQNWMGTCSNIMFWDKMSCQGNGGVWTVARRTYSTPSPAFNAYLGLQEDIQIIENSRFEIYQSGQPTREEEKQAKLTFFQRMESAAGRISGKTNSSTDISLAQKMAVIKLLMQPSMD